MTTATRDAVADLLAVLALDRGLVQVKCFDRAGQVRLFWYDSPAALLRDWRQLEAVNRQGFGVYYGVATYSERKGTKDKAAWLWTVHADLDGKDFDPRDWRAGKRLALDMLANLPSQLEPTALVDTGHGIHAYWPLAEPLSATPDTIARVEAVNAALAVFLGSDPAVKDVSRVLRLPGLDNVNCTWLADPEPLPVVLFGGIRGQRFDLADFAPIMTPAVIRPERESTSTGIRPGDAYNQRGDWSQLLTSHGWEQVDESCYWRRPGKESGISARLNHKGDGLLRVFSSNAGPLQCGTSYSLFGAYVALEHRGDWKAAVKALASKGYGTPASAQNARQAEYAPPAVNGNGRYEPISSDIMLSRDVDPEDYESFVAESLVPDLPKDARLPDTLGADLGGWLADYVRYASDVSERTPELMHQAAGLWLAAVAVARRLHIAMPHGDVYPNLYMLAVAKTTLFSKTTGMGVMEALLADAMPHLTLSNDSTPEAMLAEFGGKQPNNLESAEVSDDIRELWRQGQRFAAQRGLILEEASGLLAGLRKDYMQGMAELLLRLHDCPNQYRRHTKGGGYLVIRSAYLSICGWTTPVRLRTVETDMAWHDGLFARFALLTPESPGLRPSAEPRRRPERPSELVTTLSRLANSMLPMPESHQRPVKSWAVPMTPEAAAAQRRYYIALSYDLLTAKTAPDGRLFGTYGRIPAMATKIALLLAALDWAAQEGKPILQVTIEHYAQGQRIAERWRASAHRLLDELLAKPEAQEENTALDRTMKVLQRNGDGWLTIRDLVRKMDSNRYRTSEVLQFVRTLEQDGRIEVQERRAEGKGRPSLVCRLLS